LAAAAPAGPDQGLERVDGPSLLGRVHRLPGRFPAVRPQGYSARVTVADQSPPALRPNFWEKLPMLRAKATFSRLLR